MVRSSLDNLETTPYCMSCILKYAFGEMAKWLPALYTSLVNMVEDSLGLLWFSAGAKGPYKTQQIYYYGQGS